MQKIRVALVGCGPRGNYVASLFAGHPLCELTTLVDRIPQHLDNGLSALKLPSVQTYSDFETMLREAPIDAVFLASDPMEHAELACVAMEAGKHVCTEVPAAVSLEQCEKLVRTVENTGCKYQLLEQTRYWGFVDAWAGMRERGELGHICLAQGEYVHYEPDHDMWEDTETGELYRTVMPPPGRPVKPTWRHILAAEPIYYLPHTLSPLLKILDDRVVRVSCMGTRKGSYTEATPYPWSDMQYALMHTAGDTVMLIGAGFSMPRVERGQTYSHWYELRGNNGNVCSPRSTEESFTCWHPGMSHPEPMDISVIPFDATEEEAKTGHGGADYKPVDTFLRAIKDDTTPPMDVFCTMDMTVPGIIAAESARQGGALLEVPNYRCLSGKGDFKYRI